MNIEGITKKFEKNFGLSEDAALFGAVCAIAGFAIDAVFFPGGVASSTVTTLLAGGGYASYRWTTKRRFFRENTLREIDRRIEIGDITEAQAKNYKSQITDSWIRDVTGIPPNVGEE